MRHLPRSARLLALTAGLALIAPPAAADTVVLKNGTVHYGTIVEETPRSVKIHTILSNIETTLEFPKSQIRTYSIEAGTRIDQMQPKAPEPAAASTDKPHADAEPAAPTDVNKRPGVPLVLEVPLVGTFGEDIYPKSIAVALDWAANHGVTDIVFRLNSPGGEIWAAQRIVEIMDRHADQFRYHALVERGISASIWPTFACATISMPPGATLGGAVVYKIDTGSAEVDMKMNSILSAELSARAERNGHDPAVVRAMMTSESELYAWRPAHSDEVWHLTDSHDIAYFQEKQREIEVVDTKTSILTLTADQATSLGIAGAPEDATLGALARTLEFDEFDDAGKFGNEASDEWTEKCSTLRKEIGLTVREVLSDYQRYQETRSISTAMAALGSAKRGLTTLERLYKDAADLEMDPILSEYDSLDRDHLVGEINKEMGALRRARRGG